MLASSDGKQVLKNESIFGHLLSPWEIRNLEEIRELFEKAPKGTHPFSIEHLEAAMMLAAEEILTSPFRIIEMKPRRGSCQLCSWYAMETIDDLKTKVSIDHLLLQIFAVAEDKLEVSFTHRDLKDNLLRLGLVEVSHLNQTDLSRLFNLLEGWFKYRLASRLMGEDASSHLLRSQPKQKNIPSSHRIKDIPYEMDNSQPLSDGVFRDLRSKTLLLAYHDGVPHREKTMSFKTVKYFFVLKYNEARGWEVQRSEEKYPDGYWNFANLESYIKTGRPEENANYIVIHVGHASNILINKDEDQSFVNAMGLDRVNFEELFQNVAIAKTLPGELSIFHINLIQNFQISYFQNMEAFQEPHDTGEIVDFGTRSSHLGIEHPISFAFHQPNFLRGPTNEAPGVSIASMIHGRRFLLRIFFKDGIRNNEETFFLETTTLQDPSLGNWPSENTVYSNATLDDWKAFLSMFPSYLNTPIAPRIGKFIEEKIGIRMGTLQEWENYGVIFLENAKEHVRKSQADLNRFKERKPKSPVPHFDFPETPRHFPLPSSLTKYHVRGRVIKSHIGVRVNGYTPVSIQIQPTYFTKKKTDFHWEEEEQLGEDEKYQIDQALQNSLFEGGKISEEFRAYISGIQHIWLNGVRANARMRLVAPDGNCGLAVFGMRRSQFITAVLKAYKSGDQELDRMIEEAFEDAGARNIAEWTRIFHNPGYWMNGIYFRIFSRIFNVVIHTYAVATPDAVPDGMHNGDILIPIPGRQQVFDETRSEYPTTDFHLLWTSMIPGGELVHFDRILLDGERFEENVLQPLSPQPPLGLTSLEMAWMRELQRRPTILLDGNVPLKVLAILLASTLTF